MKAIKAFVATLPPLAFVLVLAGWLVGTLAGTFAAARIGRSAVPGYIDGAMSFSRWRRVASETVYEMADRGGGLDGVDVGLVMYDVRLAARIHAM